MNEETIGRAAGLIWQRLRDSESQDVTLASLKKIDGVRADEAVAAIGWLAREGKLRFDIRKRTCNVTLVERDACLV